MIEELTARKANACETAKILLPTNAIGVLAEIDLDPADIGVERDVLIEIKAQLPSGVVKTQPITARTGQKTGDVLSAGGMHDQNMLRGGVTVWATATIGNGIPIGVRLIALVDGEDEPPVKVLEAAVEGPS